MSTYSMLSLEEEALLRSLDITSLSRNSATSGLSSNSMRIQPTNTLNHTHSLKKSSAMQEHFFGVKPANVRRHQSFNQFSSLPQRVPTHLTHLHSFQYHAPKQQQQQQHVQQQISHTIGQHSSSFRKSTPLSKQIQPMMRHVEQPPTIAELTPTSTGPAPSSNFCVRFAVNGLSKSLKGSYTPPLNRCLQAGDFGDDAGMIVENAKSIVIGLADGAGGNRAIGIDPRLFSRSLLSNCVDIVKRDEVTSSQMAKLACKSVQRLETKNIEGSGTLCLLGINKQTSVMTSLNIGDSGFRLLRKGSIVHKSRATMAGSSPKQLYVSDASSFSGISFINEKEIAMDSDIREFRVERGDIIILSSDGLFDVMSDQTIEKIVNNRSEKELQGVADDLLLKTMKSYVMTQRDDILVMVCRIELKMQ